jgi:ERF superfamily
MNEETTLPEAMRPAPGLNIYQRIREIQRKVAYVRKDATVKGSGGYQAVSHDMVTAVVRPFFVELGVAIVPRIVSSQTVNTGRSTAGGSPIIRFEGLYELTFVNVDDPADTIVLPVAAHAEDHGDKAPGKALSYAVKSGLLKILMLESGDADEGRLAPPDPELTEPQEERLQELRDAALNGLRALQVAWDAIGKDNRMALAHQLDSLKEAARKAEESHVG